MKSMMPAQFSFWLSFYHAILSNDSIALQSALNTCPLDSTELQALINCTCVPPTKEEENTRPLLLQAASKGNKTIVDLLLKAGADIDVCLSDGWTALITSLDSQHTDLARHLIANGADIHARTSADTRVLDFVLFNGDLNLAHILLQQGETPEHINKNGVNSLHHAAESGSVETVQHILEKTPFRADTADLAGMRPLDRSGSLDVFHYLHQQAPDLPINIVLNDKGLTSAMNFAREGQTQIVLAMLDLGVDLHATTADGSTLLHYAALARDGAELVKALISMGANVASSNKIGNKPLHWAVKGGCLDSVKALVNAGSHIDAENKVHFIIDEFKKPLYLAIEKGQGEIARYLIEMGADVNAVNDDAGSTPLTAACNKDDLPMIRYLLDHGAHPGGVAYKGRDALFLPLGEVRSPEAAQMLIDAGADVNERTRLDDTVLHILVDSLDPNHPKWRMYPNLWQQQLDLIRVIVGAGGDPLQRDGSMKTVLSYAEHNDIKEILSANSED